MTYQLIKTDLRSYTTDRYILFATGNLCVTLSRSFKGVGKDGAISDKTRSAVMDEMRAHFRPEFLNRVDEIVLFKTLNLSDIKAIVVLLIREIQRRLMEKDITLKLSEEAVEFIAREGFDPVYGARPLKRFLKRELETSISRPIIAGDILEGATILVNIDNESLNFIIDHPSC